MARRMSFSMTTAQYLDGSKTVTRRLGWLHAKAGDEIMGIEKGMGLKKGEKQVKLGAAIVTSVRRERLDAITADDCAAEGFPELGPAGFVAMFCKSGRCKPDAEVTRIEFLRLPECGCHPVILDGELVSWHDMWDGCRTPTAAGES